jgi:tetratricopeptide (TPR) repeat protein
MAEPRRSEIVPTPDAADRTSQSETLLIEGLDRYFGGRYEEAIHVWTRVLFLDRSHARARAYIDRARTAIAERQRRSEELLQASQDLLDRGRTDEARDLLTEAVAEGGDDERASAVRVRLERLERAHAGARPPRSLSVTPTSVVPGWTWPRRSPAVVGLAVVFGVGALFIVVVTSPAVQRWMGAEPANEVLATSTGPNPLPALSSEEVALLRARALYGQRRLVEALQALDRVGADSPMRAEADELRIEIQRLVLGAGPERVRSTEGGVHR